MLMVKILKGIVPFVTGSSHGWRVPVPGKMMKKMRQLVVLRELSIMHCR
jgi:hypothetical protein